MLFKLLGALWMIAPFIVFATSDNMSGELVLYGVFSFVMGFFTFNFKTKEEKERIVTEDKRKITETDWLEVIKIEEKKLKAEIEAIHKANFEVEVEKKSKVKPKDKKDKKVAKQKTEPKSTKSKGDVVFVDYNFYGKKSTKKYPILRYPKKGNVVRSYKLGKSKRRGYKEEAFQDSIQKFFGIDFLVLGNARLNTGKGIRPFEPDIAIIDKSNSSNLRIDIEIDEPYAGISRQTTHCIGEDKNRDIYFIDRGWIVLRFSEHQVHLNENECLKFIAETIKKAIPNYYIPTQLSNKSSLKAEKLWDIVKAQKWEKANYREQYLNHTFQTTEEQIETIERDFDKLDQKEEDLVKPTFIGSVNKKKPLAFNLQNINSRDSRIKFYPEPHIYTIDNTPAPSVSTIISKFFPEFDSYDKASNLSRHNPLYGFPVDEILEIWSSRGIEAAKQGTYLHEQIEKFYLGQNYENTDEFHLFEQFNNDHLDLIPYRTEWRVFDEEHHIAGTIDLIAKNGQGYELYDWKRSKKIIDTFSGSPIKKDTWGNFGVGQLSNIDDTSFNRYCLQQSLYKYIIEKNYGLKVSKMYLIVLYPDYEQYYKVKVPYLKDEAEYILNSQ